MVIILQGVCGQGILEVEQVDQYSIGCAYLIFLFAYGVYHCREL